jgi:hypothetical protein
LNRIEKILYSAGLIAVLVLSTVLGACNVEPETITETEIQTTTKLTTQTETKTETVTETVTDTVTEVPLAITDDRGETFYFDEPVETIISLVTSPQVGYHLES